MKAYSIGREANCDIVIYDSTDVVSRRHAVLNVYPSGKMYIVDQSRNGTYVNGIRVTPNVQVPVTRKDIISFAHVVKLDWNQVPAANLWMRIAMWVLGVILLLGIGFGGYHMYKKPTVIPVPDSVSLDSINFNVEADGRTLLLSFTTNKEWKVSVDQSWCTMNRISGEAGTDSIKVTIAANTTEMERTAKVTVKAGTATAIASVKQAKKKEEVKKKEENKKKKKETGEKKKEEKDKKKDDPATRNIG